MPLTTVQANRVPNLVEFTIDGKLDARQMSELHGRIRTVEDNAGPVRLYVEFQDFDGWSSVEDFFKFVKKDLALLGRVDRYAYVCGSALLEKLTPLVNALTPNMEAKIFGNGDTEAALDWLAGTSE